MAELKATVYYDSEVEMEEVINLETGNVIMFKMKGKNKDVREALSNIKSASELINESDEDETNE